MRLKIAVAALLLSSICSAKEPKHYQTGTLLQMDSVACGVDEKDGKSFIAPQNLQIKVEERDYRRKTCRGFRSCWIETLRDLTRSWNRAGWTSTCRQRLLQL